MSQIIILRFAAILLSTAVALGAIGAHALSSSLEPAALDNWRTAVQYQFVMGAALMAATALWPYIQGRFAQWGILMVMAGILIFCLTLYALCLGVPRSYARFAPTGGMLMILGWLLVAVSVSAPSSLE